MEFPLWWASAATVIIFAGLLVLTWKLDRGTVMEDAPDQERWRDLRIWASVLISVQLLIYYVFS